MHEVGKFHKDFLAKFRCLRYPITIQGHKNLTLLRSIRTFLHSKSLKSSHMVVAFTFEYNFKIIDAPGFVWKFRRKSKNIQKIGKKREKNVHDFTAI